ncbi:putative ankyrin repeat-containing domain-containing protein [Helianthus anomalus]
MQASNVNVSNFVSVKLSGRSNYDIWKVQMLVLIKSQNLLPVIINKSHHTLAKYDTLVKGWILSTINEQRILSDLNKDIIDDDRPAKELWKELESIFDPSKSDSEDPLGFGIEFISDTPDIETENSRTEFVRDPEIQDTDNIRLKKELYEAAAQGWWTKAKSILKGNKIAATEAITANGNTILHLAVEMGHNYFVEKLLEFLEDGEDIETQNDKGRTALHIAAMVGNKQAAHLLVKKRKQLLEFEDHNNLSPLKLASAYSNLNVYAYLFKSAPPSETDMNLSSFHYNSALVAAIFSKNYGEYLY